MHMQNTADYTDNSELPPMQSLLFLPVYFVRQFHYVCQAGLELLVHQDWPYVYCHPAFAS